MSRHWFGRPRGSRRRRRRGGSARPRHGRRGRGRRRPADGDDAAGDLVAEDHRLLAASRCRSRHAGSSASRSRRCRRPRPRLRPRRGRGTVLGGGPSPSGDGGEERAAGEVRGEVVADELAHRLAGLDGARGMVRRQGDVAERGEARVDRRLVPEDVEAGRLDRAGFERRRGAPARRTVEPRETLTRMPSGRSASIRRRRRCRGWLRWRRGSGSGTRSGGRARGGRARRRRARRAAASGRNRRCRRRSRPARFATAAPIRPMPTMPTPCRRRGW